MILISACLAGVNVRYNKTSVFIEDDFFSFLLYSGKAVLYCPECMGGMSIPRSPAEIIGRDGYDVLEQRSIVKNIDAEDVTAFFIEGVEKAEGLIKKYGINYAILKENSPSCGSNYIYDGSFTNKLKQGLGVFAAFLEKSGVGLFNENNFYDLKKIL